MSEDFEGKAQDIDKENDNDESDQEEEEEPDVKEMGETEEGAEKLEKEVSYKFQNYICFSKYSIL